MTSARLATAPSRPSTARRRGVQVAIALAATAWMIRQAYFQHASPVTLAAALLALMAFTDVTRRSPYVPWVQEPSRASALPDDGAGPRVDAEAPAPAPDLVAHPARPAGVGAAIRALPYSAQEISGLWIKARAHTPLTERARPPICHSGSSHCWLRCNVAVLAARAHPISPTPGTCCDLDTTATCPKRAGDGDARRNVTPGAAGSASVRQP